MAALSNVQLRVRVFDNRGRFLGGKVDIELVHRRRRERTRYRTLDASRAIRLGVRRRRWPWYKVTVVPTLGLPPQSELVRVRPRGVTSVDFVYPIRGLARAESETYTVSGRVSSPGSASIAGLRVQIIDRNVARDIPVVETTTDERGNYRIRFEVQPTTRGKTQFDFQARVFSREALLGASEVRYNATREEVLNVVLPKSAELATEHDALTSAISRHFVGQLGTLQETDERADITYLANKTGWDARAVALAALADQFSQIRGPGRAAEGISAPLYYALFRAGLPANENSLFQIDSGTINRVWKRAIESGVISKEVEAKLPRALEAFQELSAETLLTVTAPAAVSTLQDMLAVARLTEPQQQQLASLYAQNRTDLPAFWTSVAATFGRDVADRLQLNGKLGLLTLNNAALMGKVQAAVGGNAGLTDTVELARAGLYRASKWNDLLVGDIAIPDRIPGDTPEARKDNYAAFLSAQIRLSYPTAAVADMVQSGDIGVGRAAEVHAFLRDNHGQFEIGVQPVEQYIKRKQLDVPAPTVTEIKRLQRVYQLTPSDGAMSALITRGVDSAYHIVRHERDAFIREFAADLGGEDQARVVYDKASHVHNAVLNVAVSYLGAKNGIVLGTRPLTEGDSDEDRALRAGGGLVQPGPSGGGGADVIAYPTLEGLFGSMDF